MLSDDEILKAAIVAFSRKQLEAVTYNKGPYEITTPTFELVQFARAIERKVIQRCADELDNIWLEGDVSTGKMMARKFRAMLEDKG